MEKLLRNSENPIASIEMLGVACALLLWHDVLIDRAAIIFVDNEASKCCLIKGYSPQVDMAAICTLCTRCEIDQKCILYFERVASPSNIGDGPSRFVRPPPLPSWGSALRSRLDALGQPPPTTASPNSSSFSARQVSMGMRDAPIC